MLKTIQFVRNGQLINGFVLAQDEDTRAALWVVDANDADTDYFVMPCEIVNKVLASGVAVEEDGMVVAEVGNRLYIVRF